MDTLYDKLRKYGESDHYGFHMPGHKRRPGIAGLEKLYQIDITEIEGFDDLHHAKGILKEAQERAAEVFHAEETHFLINGSTVGILSALAGVTKKGDTVLVARNCHKSVYHAVYMKELKPIYLYPSFDQEAGVNTQIAAKDVRAALKRHPEIRAVVIVSPTYEGVVSDVADIAREVHEKGIPLIVDEAHGAHFGFHPYFPENSNTKGADLVVHSLHKTLPSLTQTALLHINGPIVDRAEVRRYLDMLQTSSPSYVLMASIDYCIHQLETCGGKLWPPYVERLERLRKELAGLRRLKLIQRPDQDPSKLVIQGTGAGMNGRELYKLLLDKYQLQMEMAAGGYVLAMTSPGDTDEGMERLSRALFDIDEMSGLMYNASKPYSEVQYPRLEQVFTSAEAARRREGGHGRRISWEESEGAVSMEYAYLYPPGIPLIVPGERINAEAVEILKRRREQGFFVEGLEQDGRIEVWTNG